MNQKRFSIRSAVVGLVALGATVALAACGGGGSPVSTEEPGQPATVRILLAPVFYESVYLAEREGYFDDANLTVEITEGGAASEQIPQLLSGQYDIIMTSSVSVVQAIDKGLPIKIIANQLATPAGDSASGILVPADSDIEDFGDLEGHTLALQGLQDNAHLAALMAIGLDGGDPSTVETVQLPLPAINDAITSGQVDAGYPLSIFYGAGLGAGLRTLGSPTAYATPDGPNVVYAATDDYIAAKEDVLTRFNEAIARATALGVEDDQNVRDIQLEHSTLPPDYIATAIINPANNSISRKGLQNVLDGMLQYDFIGKKITFDEVVAPVATVVD